MNPIADKVERKKTPLPNPVPLWLWILIIIGIVAFAWPGVNWLATTITRKSDIAYTHKITNRDISLFLWQNPSNMRIYAKTKMGFLSGFPEKGRVTPNLQTVDDVAIAPSAFIYQYNTWNILIGDYVISRKIPPLEFQEFLSYAGEWQADNWPSSSKDYRFLIVDLAVLKIDDMQTLPVSTFPNQVRLAFIGWKNFFKEKDLIKQQIITFSQMSKFLEKYPYYSRNHWRNFYPKYLEGFLEENINMEETIPEDQLQDFLKIGFFNYQIEE